MVVLCAFLVIACFYDYGSYRIPNALLLGMIPVGMVYRIMGEGAKGAFLFLMATVLTWIMFYPFFKIGGIGAGDVKLLGVCGGFFPAKQILLFLFFLC